MTRPQKRFNQSVTTAEMKGQWRSRSHKSVVVMVFIFRILKHDVSAQNRQYGFSVLTKEQRDVLENTWEGEEQKEFSGFLLTLTRTLTLLTLTLTLFSGFLLTLTLTLTLTSF